MIFGVEFRQPLLLLLLVLVPLVYWLARRSQGHIIISSLSLFRHPQRSWRSRLHWLPAACLTFAAALMVVAAAGPRVGDRDSVVQKEGIAIMMAIDTSSSMRALDLSPRGTEQTRLDVVKKVFERFVLGDGTLPGRSNDLIGLVRFAGYADTASPLTLDHGSLVGAARAVELVSTQTEDGTAIGDALALAVGRIKDAPARSKVVVLLTDGVNNAGVDDPLASADLARTEQVKVYTIGAGTNGMAPVRAPDPFTGRQVLRQMPVQIDEELLQEIAERSSGQYFRATDFDRLSEIYAEIDALERTEISQTLYRQYTEYYVWLMSLGLLFAFCGFALDATVLRRSP